MSPLRKVFFIAAVPFGLAAIAFGLVCLSPVQTWLARRILSAQPDTQAELGNISIGWNTVRVTDLTISQPGLKLHLPSAEIDVPLFGAVRGQVDVTRLMAQGWTVELSAESKQLTNPKREAASGAPVHGVFDLLDLPVGLSVDGVDLLGRVLMPEGQADVKIVGRGLAPAREGSFSLDVAMTSVDAELGRVTMHAELNAHQLTAKRFDRLKLAMTVAARGPQIPAGVVLDIVLNSEQMTTGGETHVLRLTSGERDLVKLDAVVAANAEPITGTWAIDVRDTDLAPFAMGQVLPGFVIRGAGKVSSDVDGSHPDVSGQLQVALDRLGSIAPALTALGRVNLTAEFAVSKSANRLRVRDLSLALAGDEPALSVNALQGFSFDMNSGEFLPEQPVNDLATIAITTLPMSWVQAVVPDFKLQGSAWSGAWRVTHKDDLITVRPVKALMASGIDVDQAGAPLLRSVDMSIATGGTYGPSGWQADLMELLVSQEGRALFKLNAKATGSVTGNGAISLTGGYESDIRALLTQPFAPQNLGVTDGRIRGEVSGSISDTRRVQATLLISNLRTARAIDFPSLALTLRATQDAAGRIDAEAPLEVIGIGGRRSDVLLKAVVDPTDEPTRISSFLNSNVVYLEDVQAFAALASDGSATGVSAPVEEDRPTPEAGPFWSSLRGEAGLLIKRFVYAVGVESTDITGTIKIGPEGLSLESLRAVIGASGKLQAAGKLTHDVDNAKPYAVNGDLKIEGFDPGPFLQVAGSGRPPVLEGHFDLTAKLEGRAERPSDLGDRGLGQIELTGTAGTLRALGVKLTSVANLASPASAFLGLVGAATGNQTAIKYSAATDVVGQLSAVKFDRINLSVSRDAAQNLAIKNLALDSRWLRLMGAGEIKNRPGFSVFSQPLTVDLQLLAKGRLADGLNTLRLLGAEADAEGYLPLVEKIKLDGTLENIGASQFQRLIERALR